MTIHAFVFLSMHAHFLLSPSSPGQLALFMQFVNANVASTDSTRLVRPLALSFVGHAWLLTAWCELRLAFRNFRLDRVTSLAVLDATFAPEAGKRWEDFLALIEEESSDPHRG